MIGPSSGTGGVPNRELSDSQSRATKKRLFEDLDIENFCEEIQNGRKRYLQEIETPMELIASNQMIGDPAAFFSPLSVQEATGECPVARLEVLLVDGTNCTWTTMSDVEQQHRGLAEIAAASSSTSSSPSLSSEHRREHLLQGSMQIDGSNYHQIDSNYWESIVTMPSADLTENKGNVSMVSSNSTQFQQQQFDDQETGNLSWLLDFKLDPFIESADDKSTGGSLKENHYGNKTKLNGRSHGATYVNDIKRNYNSTHENSSLPVHRDTSQAYPNSDNRNLGSSRYSGPKKPPFTYTELIEHALRERGELTVSAIYQWISEHFPYYKSNDDRWKNSVRHNLSINPHFRKGSKAPHGAGHLWAIANRSLDSRPRQILSTPATNSATRQTPKNTMETENPHRPHNQITSIDEVEAATASITQQSSEDETENIVNSVTLEHCAEQILSGIKKEVEVQYLVPMMVSGNEHGSTQINQQTQELQYSVKESDFLNPVSKEVVAEECGLISEGYLVTDLNPATLGLNMADPEIITPENLFGEELSFQFYELTSPSQIQSA